MYSVVNMSYSLANNANTYAIMKPSKMIKKAQAIMAEGLSKADAEYIVKCLVAFEQQPQAKEIK